MIEIVLHLWSVDLVIPRSIKPEVRAKIYRPINQLKEKPDNKIVQTAYKKTNCKCISKYRFEKHKDQLLTTIEVNLTLLGLTYSIVDNTRGKRSATIEIKQPI